jgi:hypothetical protein
MTPLSVTVQTAAVTEIDFALSRLVHLSLRRLKRSPPDPTTHSQGWSLNSKCARNEASEKYFKAQRLCKKFAAEKPLSNIKAGAKS